MKRVMMAMLFLAACKGHSDSCSVTSLGAWPQNSTVDVTCGNDSRQLKCDPAGSGAKTTTCTCNANGVVGSKVTVEVTEGGMLAGEPKGVVKTACGWQ